MVFFHVASTFSFIVVSVVVVVVVVVIAVLVSGFIVLA